MSLSETVDAIAEHHSWADPVIVFVTGIFVLFSRRPDALLNPQFFIEDGAYWYAQAHEVGGFRALLVPSYRGYMHTVPRLGALLVQPLPLRWAPFGMNLLAIAIAALPASFIVSRRFERVVPNLWVRLLIAFLYLAMPGAWTTMANMTHTQWHFALLACLVVLAAPPVSTTGKILDVTITALSGLTGPTAIFLIPIAALVWLLRRERWTLTLLGVTAATAVVEATTLLLTVAKSEGAPPLGASWMSFIAIFVRRVVYGTLLGEAESRQLFANASGFWLHPATLLVAAAAAVALMVFALLRSPLELRLLILFAMVIYVPSLCWPPEHLFSTESYWQILADPGSSNRYFIIPIFTLLVSLVWLASAGPALRRYVGMAALAAAVAIGVRLDWREPPLRDYEFEQFVAKYDRAQPGERVQFITPPGWSFVLTKR